MNVKELCQSSPAIKQYIETLPREILESGTAITIERGFVIVFRGDILRSAYILLKGELGIVYDGKEGKSHLFNNLTPFKIISDIEVLAEEEYYCSTVTAEKSCILFRFPIQIFKNCLAVYPDFSKEVIRSFASCAYRISMKRGFQAYGSATQKLAIHLLMTATSSPPTLVKPFIIEKTRQTLAEELELSVKTINRSVDTLKADGYLTVLNRKIIMDETNFQKISEDFL